MALCRTWCTEHDVVSCMVLYHAWCYVGHGVVSCMVLCRTWCCIVHGVM